MLDLTLSAIVAVTGGALVGATGDERVTGPVVADSRESGPGGLFLAFAGEHADGHEHAAAAVAAGAVAALVSRPVPGVPCVVVDDVLVAVSRLATAHLDSLAELTVVGVTGSSGKTSTKDLLAQVLAVHGPTVAPQGSYNNELGVPLTVLQADASTRFLVVEMGARGIGHVAHLCRISPPQVGVVLNVGSAHLGEFGSREAIAAAKGELPEALPEDGTAVLNGDDPAVRAMASRTRARRVVFFGENAQAQVRAESVRLDSHGRAGFDLVTPQGSAPVRLGLVGEHHVSNALAAAAVAVSVGMTLPDVAAALSSSVARSRWRMEVTERADGLTVVNDAYNANPESVRAALKSLVAMAQGRRTVAVLGEMLELGEDHLREHDAIGRLAVRLNVSQLVVVGRRARSLHLAAGMEGSWDGESVAVEDVDEALDWLRGYLRPGDVVLVKASRAVGLERVAEGLLA